MDSKPVAIHIGLKSGRTVDLLVSDWKMTTNRLTGELQEFSWTLHDRAKTRVLYLDLAQIESISKDL